MDLPTTIVPPISETQKLFSSVDYIIFLIMLGFSALIGIYFGFFGNKQNTADEYLLGGRTMTVLPVALSLIASQMSGVSLLVVPADVYRYGPNYWWICITVAIVSIINSYVYLPIFFKLQQPSIFEYLKLRFDRKIRTFSSFIYTLNLIIYNSIVLYVPAVAFAQVTGINVHLISSIVSIICISYTTIGGLKAVVWTDAFQFLGMLGSVTMVFFIGTFSAGGFGVVWKKGVQGHRLDLNFGLDPTVRDGFWHCLVGGTTLWISIICLNQGCLQKYLAVSTIGQARKSIAIFVVGIVVMKTMLVFTGVTLYAKYSGCDPLLSHQVTRNDQLLSYFVMDLAEGIPGLPGIFIAGIFSAALSIFSAALNTVSATVYEDFVSPFLPHNISQKQISNILKLIVLVAGLICTALILIVDRMGGIFALTLALYGITGGTLFGLFTLGALFPKANSKGAMYGGVSGFIFISWIMLGNQWYASQGLLDDSAKPVSVENCTYLNFSSIANSSFFSKDQPFVLFRISFWYSSFIGGVVVILIGLIVSWLTRRDDHRVHPDLISPAVQFLLPKRNSALNHRHGDYLSVDTALHIVVRNSGVLTPELNNEN